MAKLEEIRKWLREGGEKEVEENEYDEELDDGDDNEEEIDVGSFSVRYDSLEKEYVFERRSGQKAFSITEAELVETEQGVIQELVRKKMTKEIEHSATSGIFAPSVFDKSTYTSDWKKSSFLPEDFRKEIAGLPFLPSIPKFHSPPSLKTLATEPPLRPGVVTAAIPPDHFACRSSVLLTRELPEETMKEKVKKIAGEVPKREDKELIKKLEEEGER